MKKQDEAQISAEWKMTGDGWFQVSPFGEFPNRVGKRDIVMVMDREGLAAQAAALKARAEAEGEKFGGLLVNQDHLCVAKETAAASPTTAMGWIMELDVREDGLWARAKWSAEGERLIGGGVYKFVSGEWNLESADELGGKRVRLRELTGCALTNQPALPGLAPLCCRAVADDFKNKEPENPAERNENMDKLKELLGLPADASEEQVAEAVGQLLEAKKALEAEKADTAAEEFVKANAGKIGDAEAVKAAFKRDPEGTKTLLAALKAPEEKPLPVTARIPAQTPKMPENPAASLSEKMQGLSPEEACAALLK